MTTIELSPAQVRPALPIALLADLAAREDQAVARAVREFRGAGFSKADAHAKAEECRTSFIRAELWAEAWTVTVPRPLRHQPCRVEVALVPHGESVPEEDARAWVWVGDLVPSRELSFTGLPGPATVYARLAPNGETPSRWVPLGQRTLIGRELHMRVSRESQLRGQSGG
jgi:hypothetical protein